MRRPLLLTFALLLLVRGARAAPSSLRRTSRPACPPAGIDVSGLTLQDAANRVTFLAAGALAQPLTVSSAGHRFTLDPAKIGLKLDGLRTARRAFQAGYKKHTGKLDVSLYVTYDRKAVSAFAQQAVNGVTIAARDATRAHQAHAHHEGGVAHRPHAGLREAQAVRARRADRPARGRARSSRRSCACSRRSRPPGWRRPTAP